MKNIFTFLLLTLLATSTFSQAILYSTDYGTSTTTGGTLFTGWVAGGAAANNLQLSTASASNNYTSPITASGSANLADEGTTVGNSVATLSGMVNTINYTSIRVLFGVRGTATYTGAVTLEWSTDGISWNNLVFTAPPLDGNWHLANTTWIDLPAPTENKANLMFRFNFNRVSGLGNYRIDDFTVMGNLTGGATSAADYFRSRVSGNWGIADTWESSADNVSWVTASSVPTSSAKTITIQATHTVVISSPASADQLVIDAGGYLIHNSGIDFTLTDDVGEDMIINGSYTLYGTMPSGAGTIILPTPGASVFVMGNTGGESDNFAYSPRVTFKTDTYFYWSVSSIFESIGITYFPNSSISDHPRFIINANVGAVGSSSQTIINGYLDVRGNITFQNSGIKIFRDGIFTTINNTLTQSASSGAFIMNGAAIKFGGSGTVSLGSSAGLEISTGSVADLVADQTINGSGFFVKGTLKASDWQIKGSANFDLAGTLYTSHSNGISTSGTLATTGSISLGNSSTIVYDRSSANGNQQFSSRSDYANVQIEGGSGKILNGPATINGLLSLNSGFIVSSSANLLTISSSGNSTGASINSFVSGPVKKVGNFAFTFPVGKIVGSEYHYRFIGISAPGNVTDAFTAEFFRSDSYLKGSISTNAKNAGLQRVSRCEYWGLKRDAGNSNIAVTLSWSNQSPCNASYVTKPSTVVAAQYNGIQWGDLFGGSGTGTNTNGTVTWAGANSYEYFALGSTDLLENPLPLTLSSFSARAKNSEVVIDWHVMNNNEQEDYVLERSNNGVNFELLTKVPAKVILDQAAYTEVDQHPFKGWNYYHLKATDRYGRQRISAIVKAWFGVNEVVQVSPNPASEKIVIILSDPRSISEIELVNISGQVLEKIKNVEFYTEISISHLQAGFYYLRILGKYGLRIKSFVKN